ncbi:hypothetical protein [Hellea balneolensis]|uniref:hypothetical protein n=1 Tax=Hellea balneolensis TaxID=287478 RepID=UPI0003FF0050|nr:hypothetical protein [Hellea balneolensis]
MTKSENTPAATFSMIVAHVITEKWKLSGQSMMIFYNSTGISQPSWSRLARGQTRFDIEDLRIIEKQANIGVMDVLNEAFQVEQKAKLEGIKIIEPYTTQNKADLQKAGVAIVAGAVLAFLAVQAIKAK